eukprot:COSAG06_NODE_31278_length_524_cov_0.734118_1_plen_94_part_10
MLACLPPSAQSSLTDRCCGNVACACAQGGEKLQEAYYILQELAEKFSHTVQLLNALAVYHMLAGKYDEAQRLLNEALGKSANDPDTLANLVACL